MKLRSRIPWQLQLLAVVVAGSLLAWAANVLFWYLIVHTDIPHR